jgi:hypothetical protein
VLRGLPPQPLRLGGQPSLGLLDLPARLLDPSDQLVEPLPRGLGGPLGGLALAPHGTFADLKL